MKKLVSSALAALTVICMLSVGFSAMAAASAVFSLSPNYTTARPGDTVTVSVKVSGAKAAGGIGNAGPVILKFDTKKFSFVSAAKGAVIGDDFFSNVSGAEVFMDFNDATGGKKPVTQDGVMFVVKLKVKSGVTSGSSALSLSIPKGAVADANIKTINTTVKGTTIKFAATIAPSSVKVSNAEVVIKGTKQMTATVSPGNANNKTVTWKSSDTAVATVNAKGVVTAKKTGTAKITATTANKKTATCTVTVKAAATGVKINGAATLGVKETRQLSAAVAPSNALKTVTWKSSDTAVATVSAAGLVTAKKAGTVKITATTHNKKTHTVTITVKPAPTKVTLNKTSAALAVKKTLALTATVNSGTASCKRTWKSSDSAIAKVSSTGVVTAVKKGTAVITVTTFNGKTATCKITVK